MAGFSFLIRNKSFSFFFGFSLFLLLFFVSAGRDFGIPRRGKRNLERSPSCIPPVKLVSRKGVIEYVA